MTRIDPTSAPNRFSRPPVEQLASRLRATGAVYAALFGSLACGEACSESGVDVVVSFGKPMNAVLRKAVTGIVADAAGCSVALFDLESENGLKLTQVGSGREILCESLAARRRMIGQMHRAEDDRIFAAKAARIARTVLFKSRRRRR